MPSNSADFGNSSRPVPSGQIPRRAYGKNGIKLSIIGFGGIAVMDAATDDAARLVGEAVERGVNYFDVAPTYGNAEIMLGPALAPYRKNVFLACKTTQRTREQAAAEFEASLEHLRTEYFDLYQFHNLMEVEKDVDVVFGKGGAIELFREARKDGRIRHIGFSTHSTTAAMAAMDRFDFDSVMFPVNFASWLKNDFGATILAKAIEKGLTPLALKGMARRRWPKDDPGKKTYDKCWYEPISDPVEAALALRWTLSRPVAAAVTPGHDSLVRLAMDIAANFKPITPPEEQRLRTLALGLEAIFT